MIFDENDDELKLMLQEYIEKVDTNSLSFDEYNILINMHISHLMCIEEEDDFSENKMQQYAVLGWYIYKHILKK
jgi:hypothetical protein